MQVRTCFGCDVQLWLLLLRPLIECYICPYGVVATLINATVTINATINATDLTDP
jgi:hypothetical protein